MLYAAVRPIATLGLKYYFRRIDLANKHRIPKNAAVIIAANHPTTFIEPCVLACFLDEPLHFLARGDFFKNKIAARLLRGVHIIPVFRMRDGGFSGIKNNFESFNRSFQVLARKKHLMILAEGRCIHEKRLRPIRKGTARIALGALDNTNLEEVYIIPVGVNFTYADRLRSDVMINCGEPILASDYLADFQESATPAINALTAELRARLSQEVIIIEKIEDEPLAENLLRLYRTESGYPPKPEIGSSSAQLQGEKAIANAVNTLDESEKASLTLKTHDYFSRLERMRINDEALAGKYQKSQRKTSSVLLGLLPALFLLLWHVPIGIFTQWFSGVKIKSVEFAGPVRWAGLMVSYLLYVLLWIVLSLALWSWWPLAYTLVNLALTSWLVRYSETAREWLLAWRTKRQTEHEIKYVKTLRKEIIERVRGFWE